MRIPQPLYDGVTLAVAILGAFVACLGLANNEGSSLAAKAGAGLVLLAYFAVLAENYISRRPVPTRGGVVHTKDGRLQYAAAYALLVVFGIGAALVVALS